MVKILKQGLQAIVTCAICKAKLQVGHWETTVADHQTHQMERQVECPVCKNKVVIQKSLFSFGDEE